MKHPIRILNQNESVRVPIEFPNKCFFSGKPEALW